MIEALIKGGADIEARNGNGDTALHLAVWLNPAVVEALLDGGANVRARNSSTGRTPLQNARDPLVRSACDFPPFDTAFRLFSTPE